MHKQIKKDSQIVIRMSKTEIETYSNFCKKFNSIMSIRIRKFITFELKNFKKNNDLLLDIEKNEKI